MNKRKYKKHYRNKIRQKVEGYRQPVSFSTWEDTKKHVLETFEELLNTPKITSIQFEFSASLESVPTVSYRVERYQE